MHATLHRAAPSLGLAAFDMLHALGVYMEWLLATSSLCKRVLEGLPTRSEVYGIANIGRPLAGPPWFARLGFTDSVC